MVDNRNKEKISLKCQGENENSTNKINGFLWENTYQSISSERLWPSESTIDGLDLKLWRDRRIQRVLDAGCGDGKNLVWLVEQGFYCEGVDASATALHQCADYLSHKSLGDRYTLHSPQKLESLPFQDQEFQAAICIDVLGHIAKPRDILVELARILRPGGFLYASTFHLDDSCRLGPRMRTGDNPEEYWYKPSVPSQTAPDLEYYYHFYSEAEARILFESAPFEILSLERRQWLEPGHEKYREEEHLHVSWFALLRRI